MPKPRKFYPGILETLSDGAKKVGRWDYYDGDGAFRYAMVRYDPPEPPKRFHPWQPVGDQWAMDEQGLTRLLYRLPELRAARRTAPVFIVEGEKCVEALRALGIVATCCPGGALKWHLVPGTAEELRGRHVVILPDCDEKGRQHAQRVAGDVVSTAASVRIVELPGLTDREDVVEWLARGGTKDELYELVMTTPGYAVEVPSAQNSNPAGQDDLSGAPTSPRDALAVAKERIEHLEEWLQWLREWIANPDVSAPLKVAMIAARFHLDKAWRPDGTPKRTTMSTIQTREGKVVPGFAESYGASAQSAGDHCRQLTKMEMLNYEVRRDFVEVERSDGSKDKQPISIATLSYGRLSLQPRTVHPEAPRNGWGGKRVPACPDCKSTDLDYHVTCRNCGAKHKPSNLISVLVEETAESPSEQNSNPAGQDDLSEGVATCGEGEGDSETRATTFLAPYLIQRNLAPSPWIIENMPPFPDDLVPAPGVPLDNVCPLNDGHAHIWLPGDARDSYECRVCSAVRRRKAVS